MSRPTICLNMIVKNEAHIVHEALEAVAPHVDSWVIVDTGSDDGTQGVIRAKMAELGIPGELHERPWRDFGHNRTEALQLARGHADYIWVIDADDTLEGTLELRDLTADCYWMRIDIGMVFWRPQLFRDGLPWRYVGVLHEYVVCDEPHSWARLEGDYRVMGRQLGDRSRDPSKVYRDREVLLAQVQQHPDDRQAIFHLAQNYGGLGEHDNARLWWERYIELGSEGAAVIAEGIYFAMIKLAETLYALGKPWAQVQEAFLRAWGYRPSRAEALLAIAIRYRTEERYELGHLFAEAAARIPMPADDILFVDPATYEWRAADEQAVCASWTGRHAEAVSIWDRLLNIEGIPDRDRQRMLANRDLIAAQRG